MNIKFTYLELCIIASSVLGVIFKDIINFIILGTIIGTTLQSAYKND